MGKTRKGFDDSLTLISLFGFLVIFLLAFTSLDLTQWQTAFIMVVAGAGLMLEGNILSIRTWAKDGIQKLEVPFLLSIIFGAFTLVVGILSIPGIEIISPKLETIKGFVALFAMVFIGLQRWVIE